jgi:hypothetical protein
MTEREHARIGVYPVPQISDLANFSGRPESSYTPEANQALPEATIQWTAPPRRAIRAGQPPRHHAA